MADLIRRHDLLALPVVDAEDRPVDIVTIRDVVDALVANMRRTRNSERSGMIAPTSIPVSAR